ncbi:hypothetical protein BC830DRAFT_774415 [Chytriomyces sp. MP71]|nr:hypothetical protein BC830DRAFT_774415 [Chytriomyces sp. MP71]
MRMLLYLLIHFIFMGVWTWLSWFSEVELLMVVLGLLETCFELTDMCGFCIFFVTVGYCKVGSS